MSLFCRTEWRPIHAEVHQMRGIASIFASIFIVAYLLPARTVAQSTQSNASQQSVEEIRKQLALLKEQMSTLETRLNEIESAKAPTRAAPAAPAPPAEKQEGTIQSAETLSQ